MLDRLLALLAILALVPPGVLPVPLAAAAVFAALGYGPGRLLARVLAPEAGRAERLLLALTLSPFAVIVVAAVLTFAGVPIALGARVLAVAGAVCAVLALARVPAAVADPDRPSLAPALAWAGLTALYLGLNTYLPRRQDGWFHAAVTLQIAGRGLPVEDPDFGGLPLLYFWGYHLWSALWLHLVPHVAVWTPLVAFNVAAALAVVLAVGGLARRLGADARGQRWAVALAVLGYAPLLWLLLPARALTGDVRGWAEISRIAGQGASGALHALSPGTLHISMSFFGDKYFCLTPFAMGLPLFAASLSAEIDLLRRPTVRNAARLAVLTAATLLTHSVIGLSLLAAGAPAGAWLVWRAVRGEPGGRRTAIAFGASLAAGLALVAPYLIAVAGPKEDQIHWGASRLSLQTLVACGSLYLALAVPWFLGAVRRGSRAGTLLALTCATLAAMGAVVRLPELNQSKFFNLLFLALAPVAAMGASAFEDRSSRRRTALRAVVAFALVPSFAFLMWGFANQRRQLEESFHFPTPSTLAAWGEIERRTPPDALVIDRLAGSDNQVFARRTTLWAANLGERHWGHPERELEPRRRASHALGAGLEPDSATTAFLRRLGRPYVVVLRTPDGVDSLGALPRIAADPRFTPLAESDELRLFEWRPDR